MYPLNSSSEAETEIVSLYPVLGLYLKPIARINITIHYPQLKQSLPNGGKSVSSWEVMEKIKGLVAPDNFISLKVVKNTLEFIRFEGDLEARSILKTIVTRLDGRSLKLIGFKELLKIRAAETKVSFPSKYDWDSFFRDAKHMNEMKAGERPDTIHFQSLPCKWFADKKCLEKPMPSEKLFRRVWESFGDVRCIDIPVLDPYRQQMQSNIAGIKTFTFSQDPVFEAYVQYKDYLSFVKTMDALRGSFLLYKEDGKAWVASIKVNFDKTKHLSDDSIRKRRIERERLAEVERRRVVLPKISKSIESLEVNANKKGAVIDNENPGKPVTSGRVELKIAVEERKYMVARRKLEAIRLLDYLFERVKKQRESDMKDVMGTTEEEYASRRRSSDHRPSNMKRTVHHVEPTSEYSRERRRSRSHSGDRSPHSGDRSPHSGDRSPHSGDRSSYSADESPPRKMSPVRDHHHHNDVQRRSPRLQYMNDWEMPQNQNRPSNSNYYHGRQSFENRGGRGRGRGNFRGRRGGRVVRYSEGFRPYHNNNSQPFYDRRNDSVSLTEAYDHAYEKYFNSISKRYDDLNNSTGTENNHNSMGLHDDTRHYSRSRSRSRSRSVSYSRSQSPPHYSKYYN